LLRHAVFVFFAVFWCEELHLLLKRLVVCGGFGSSNISTSFHFLFVLGLGLVWPSAALRVGGLRDGDG
jgi:hypothetical protein